MNVPDSYLDLTLRSVLALYGKPRKGNKKPVAVSAVLAAVNVMAKRTAAEQKLTTSLEPAKKTRKSAAKKKARPRKGRRQAAAA
jgi:hypothetical protein